MSLNNSNSSKHFSNLQRFIAKNYYCREHGVSFNFFHLKRKSLFCHLCIDEMENYLNPVDLNDLFNFDSKEEILAKFLEVFKIKNCERHNKPFNKFCLYHIIYYCDDCARNSYCDRDYLLKLNKYLNNSNSISTGNKIVHFHNNGKIFKQSDTFDRGNTGRSFNDIINIRNFSRDSDRNNRVNSREVSTISANDSSYAIIKKLQEAETHSRGEEKKYDPKSLLDNKMDLFKNYDNNTTYNSNIQNKLSDPKQNFQDKPKIDSTITKTEEKLILSDKSQSFANYPNFAFINGKNLIIFKFFKRSEKYQITKTNIKNNLYIIRNMDSSKYQIQKDSLATTDKENILIIIENSLNLFEEKTKELIQIHVFNKSQFKENQDNFISYILGKSSDHKVYGLNHRNEYFYFDLESKNFKFLKLDQEDIIKKSNCSELNESFSFDEFYHSDLYSHPTFEYSDTNYSSSEYLFIHLMKINRNGFTFAIYNNNFSKLDSSYKNEKIFIGEFKEDKNDENYASSFSHNLYNKIHSSLCKNLFFYYCLKTKRLFLIFIFEDEVCHFLIDLHRRKFKLLKSYSLNGIDICLDKVKDSDGSLRNLSLNLRINSKLYYLNKDYVLIEYDIESNKFNEYFEFM